MIVITPPCHKWFHRNSYQKIDIPAPGVWLESVSTLTAWGAFGGYLPSLAQKLTPPFLCCCKINPADEMSLTALVLWTKVQSCFKGWLGISQVDRATFHFGLNYLLSKRNTSLPMPDPVQWKGPSSVSEAYAAVVGQEAREGFISEWWMRLLKIVNEVLVILHKSCSFTFLPWLHFIFFMTCYWGLGDLAQNALSY